MHNSKQRVILNQKGTKKTIFGILGFEKKSSKFFFLYSIASRRTKLKKNPLILAFMADVILAHLCTCFVSDGSIT